METSAKGSVPAVVVMVPLPLQGHLNQLLHLSCLISAANIPVHFLGSTAHNKQAKCRLQGWDSQTVSNIHFHDIPVPPLPAQLLSPKFRNKLPAHMEATIETSTPQLRQSLATLLLCLAPTARRIAIIHDCLMSFAAQESATIPNAEAYMFHSSSAFTQVFYMGKQAGMTYRDLLSRPLFDDCFTESFLGLMNSQVKMMAHDVGAIYNTVRAIEGEFLDLLDDEQASLGKRTSTTWAIGPLNPIVVKEKRQHKCLDWLEKQPVKSVLFVSFGTTASFLDGQILQLAMALKWSRQRFIWVLRDADKEGILLEEERSRNELPEKYEEELQGIGMVIRDWAPQLDILGHTSTGGFFSHCGWNSCIESISFGIPLITWPMHSDQPRNAMLITDVLKIGVSAREWAQRKEVVSADVIEFTIRRLMESDEGEVMRKRAEELGRAVHDAWSEGGSSRSDLHAFIAHITR